MPIHDNVPYEYKETFLRETGLMNPQEKDYSNYSKETLLFEYDEDGVVIGHKTIKTIHA